MERRLTPELMDDPGVDRAELARALRYLRRLNRRLGGTKALLTHLRRWSARWPRGATIRILDVGTGSADIPLAAARWGREAGFDVRVTGLDLHEKTVEIAREQVAGEERVTIERGDACHLRELFAADSFDYAHAALFLHHLTEINVLSVLAGMHRVARKGIVWSDLVRSRFHRFVAGLTVIGQPEIVRHDARVSFEAGFTRSEALDLARRVDITYARYERPAPWYRFTLAGEKPAAWG